MSTMNAQAPPTTKASRHRLESMEDGGLESDEQPGCCEAGGCVRAGLSRQWLNLLLATACVTLMVFAYVDGANGFYVGAAIAGAVPAARLVVTVLEFGLRLCTMDMVMWYTVPVLWHMIPCGWATVVLVTMENHPLNNSRLHLWLSSFAWLLLGWALTRCGLHVALQSLHHMLTLAHTPNNHRRQRRALMLLAHLYWRATGDSRLNTALTEASARAAAASAKPSLPDVPEGEGAPQPPPSPTHQRASSGPPTAPVHSPGGPPPTHSQAPTATVAGVGPPPVPGQSAHGFAPVRGSVRPRDNVNLHKSNDDADDAKSVNSGRSGTPASRTEPPSLFLSAPGGLSGFPTTTNSFGSRDNTVLPFMRWRSRRNLKASPSGVKNDGAQLEAFLGMCEDPDRRQAALAKLFKYIQSVRNGRLVVSAVSLQKTLQPQDAALLVSQLGLFRRVFTKEEFVKALLKLQNRFSRFSRTNAGHITWTLRTLADVTLAAMMPIAMLVLMGVDPIQILVPALSTIVALSFVFAPSLQQFVTCLVFVLVQHPFDVGDVVVVEGTPYAVDTVKVMTTSFINLLSNARVIMPNAKLAMTVIENGQRSNHAVIKFDVYVDPYVTAQQVKQLSAKLRTYMRVDSKDDWLQPAEPWIAATDVKSTDGKMCLTVFGSTWVPWNTRGAVFTVRSGLMLATSRALKELGINHEEVVHRVDMVRPRLNTPRSFAGDNTTPTSAGFNAGMSAGIGQGMNSWAHGGPGTAAGAGMV